MMLSASQSLVSRLVGILLVASTAAMFGCGDGPSEKTTDSSASKDVDISGKQGGGDAAESANDQKMGVWVDVGDGVKAAVLGWKKAATTGGQMLKPDMRAVAVKLQWSNDGDSVVNLMRKPAKLLAGDEQHGAGMQSAAAGAAFPAGELDGLPVIGKLLPGLSVHGWVTFAPKDSEVDDLSVLFGRSGNPVTALRPNQIVASIKLQSADDLPPLATGKSLQANQRVGQTQAGGAVDVTVTALGKAAAPKINQPGQAVYVADVTLTNKTAESINVNNAAVIDSYVYGVDAQGNIYAPAILSEVMDVEASDAPAGETDMQRMMRQMRGDIRQASWPKTLAAAESGSGKIAFVVPDQSSDLKVVIDTAIGYKLTMAQQINAAPIGVWSAAQ